MDGRWALVAIEAALAAAARTDRKCANPASVSDRLRIVICDYEGMLRQYSVWGGDEP